MMDSRYTGTPDLLVTGHTWKNTKRNQLSVHLQAGQVRQISSLPDTPGKTQNVIHNTCMMDSRYTGTPDLLVTGHTWKNTKRNPLSVHLQAGQVRQISSLPDTPGKTQNVIHNTCMMDSRYTGTPDLLVTRHTWKNTKRNP